ncbi:MAG: hypothetical protein ABMA25_06875 [Ilumatobacteraceae bacterium]
MRSRVLAPFVVALMALAACDSAYEEPSVTVGSLPPEPPATTLLPEVVVSFVPDDTNTLPPDTLFGGNLCSALVAADFSSVTFAGVSTGRLTDTLDITDDLCGYVVRVSGTDYTIKVRARSQSEFSENGQQAEALTGIGVAASGVEREADESFPDGSYEVFVKVDNGYFSVLTTDASSAKSLAKAAVERAFQG